MLQGRHFSMVVLVIVPHKVQDSVKNQPADFARCRVPFSAGVSSRRFSRDHNIAQKVCKFELPGTILKSARVLSSHLMARREQCGNFSGTVPCPLRFSLPGE